jgi:hypothetical protein
MPITKTIDPERLRTLAENPANGVKEICAGLGIAGPTLYQQMGRDPSLKQIFTEARALAKAARNNGHAPARQSAKKKSRKAVAPPPQGACRETDRLRTGAQAARRV